MGETAKARAGALTDPAARIEVTWSVDFADTPSGEFRMCWREIGGPKVSAPQRTGFGHTVLRDMIERAVKGEVTLEFAEKGLVWRFSAPALACLANPAALSE